MNQKGFVPIIFVIGILIISAGIVSSSFYLKNNYLSEKANKITNVQSENSISLTQQPTSSSLGSILKQQPFSKSGKLRLAYAEQHLASPEKGSIYLMNVDGTEKTKIYSIEKEDSSQLLYSPLTNELLIDSKRPISTKGSLIGVNLDSSAKRVLYGKDHSGGLELSYDKKSVIVNPCCDRIFIDLNSLKISTKKADQQETSLSSNKSLFFFFNKDKKKITRVVKTTEQINNSDSQPTNTDIIVTDLTSGLSRTFNYPKRGKLTPLFIKDSFLYFLVNDAKTKSIGDFLTDLQQLNMDTGIISDPVSLPRLNELIQNAKKDKSTISVIEKLSPDESHLLYTISTGQNSNLSTKFYIYDIIQDSSSLLIENEHVDAPYLTWSSDSKWLLLNSQLKTSYFLYNISEKTLQTLDLPYKLYILIE